MKDKVILIIVFYNPTNTQIENANNMALRNRVLVVDNSNLTLDKKHHFKYISLGGNKGIAAAQNVGIEYAKKLHVKYVLFFDQDSNLDESFVDNIVAEYERLRVLDPKIVMLGPSIVDSRSGQLYKSNNLDCGKPTKRDAIISSGSIVETECFNKVGNLDETLFIDYVDFEWCWRATSKGYSIYSTPNIVLQHSIGENYHNYNGFVVNVSSPIRYFYQYRNTALLLKRGYVPLKWKIKSVLRKLADFIIIPFFAEKKFATLGYMIKGTIVGVKMIFV